MTLPILIPVAFAGGAIVVVVAVYLGLRFLFGPDLLP